MDQFTIKDSGERQNFTSGMVRDVTTGKTDWHRVADGPMLARWARYLTGGKEKYPDVEAGHPNWMLADGHAEFQRFRQSAFRHFMQWYFGQRDEDHAAAVYFNINGAEYVKANQADEAFADFEPAHAACDMPATPLDPMPVRDATVRRNARPVNAETGFSLYSRY